MKTSNLQVIRLQFRSKPLGFWLLWAVYCVIPLFVQSGNTDGTENLLWLGGLLSLMTATFGFWILHHPSRWSVHLGSFATSRAEFLFSLPISRQSAYMGGVVFYLALILSPALLYLGWDYAHRDLSLPAFQAASSTAIAGWILLQITVTALLVQLSLILPLSNWMRFAGFSVVGLGLLAVPFFELFGGQISLPNKCYLVFCQHWICFLTAAASLLIIAERTAWKQSADIEV